MSMTTTTTTTPTTPPKQHFKLKDKPGPLPKDVSRTLVCASTEQHTRRFHHGHCARHHSSHYADPLPPSF
jgi:hypothetical protein